MNLQNEIIDATLQQISDGVDKVVAQADRELALYRQSNKRIHLDNALRGYEWASTVGHEEANLKYSDLFRLNI